MGLILELPRKMKKIKTILHGGNSGYDDEGDKEAPLSVIYITYT
jgi:hypothetical protein